MEALVTTAKEVILREEKQEKKVYDRWNFETDRKIADNAKKWCTILDVNQKH